MSATPGAAPHVIVIMTDQHARYAAGLYGSPVVRTPHLDALAERATVFETAYCSSPMCVPSRASIMTGRSVHEIGAWDNAHAYAGSPEGWAHVLRRAGVRTAVIGKMHFRSAEDDTGFAETVLPLDVTDGLGDVYSLIRDEMPARPALADLVRQAGPGESPYLAYDRSVADAACEWLDHAAQGEPWALMVSFATPHHPLLAPPDYWELYEDVEHDPEAGRGHPAPPESQQHPYPAELRRVMGVDTEFSPGEIARARRAYYALCTLADDLVGQVLDRAAERGFDPDNTVIVYTSDHGTSMGERGLWWKHHLYEESVGVPLVVAGPGFAAGRRITVPVSLTSLYATILHALDQPGEAPSGQADGPPRTTSLNVVDDRDPDPPGVLAEYHGLGASSAAFMLRHGRWKLVHYATQPPQLFDLEDDPGELHDLAGDPAYADVVDDLTARLRDRVDPEGVDSAARRDQQDLVERLGGREAILARGFTIPYTPVPEDE